MAVLVLISQGPDFVRSLRPPRTLGVDFFQDWASARNLIDGLPAYMSHREAIQRYLGFRPENVNIDINVNAHPPTSILLALPFARFDYPNAVLAWNLVSLAALALSLWITAQQLGIRPAAWAIFPLITLLLLCAAFREQMSQGQLNLVLLLLITGTWAFSRSERPLLAGVLLGTTAAIKLFPGFLFIYFCLRRQWRVVAAGIASFASVTALTLALTGWETFRSYRADAMPQVEQLGSSWINVSVPGLWAKLFDPRNPLDHVEALWRSPALARIGAMACVLVILAVLTAVILKARRLPEQDRAFGLTLTAMLLISPLTWHHYFLLLLLPVMLLWRWLPPGGLMRAIFLADMSALFFINPLQLADAFIEGGYPAATARPIHTITVLSVQCYALIAFFVLCLVTLEQENAPTS